MLFKMTCIQNRILYPLVSFGWSSDSSSTIAIVNGLTVVAMMSRPSDEDLMSLSDKEE